MIPRQIGRLCPQARAQGQSTVQATPATPVGRDGDSLGVTRGAVLNWLRRIEEHDLAHTTQPGRRSRNQTWARTHPERNGQDE